MSSVRPAFDPSSVRRTLTRMGAKGLCTVEDLDKPSDGYLLSTGQRWNPVTNRTEWHDYRTPLGHTSAVPKHQIQPHKNLLRDPEPIEAVEASPSPRDLAPGPVPTVRSEEPQVLLPEETELHSAISERHKGELKLSEPIPF